MLLTIYLFDAIVCLFSALIPRTCLLQSNVHVHLAEFNKVTKFVVQGRSQRGGGRGGIAPHDPALPPHAALGNFKIFFY